MIITRTPFRISFFGGGTDYPVYYREHGGAVISATIDKYCYVTVRRYPPFFDHKYHVRYSKREMVQTIDQIEHPSVRECIRFSGYQDGVEVVHAGDLPARSGIGSSSSFTVGLLHALYALQGRMATRRQLAFDAIQVEQNMIRENVGSQDQMAAAFGGLNRIEFHPDGGIWVTPVTIGPEKVRQLQSSLLFYFTGLSRTASEIAAEQIRSTPGKSKELQQMKEMVEEATGILNGPPDRLDDFGRLLHDSWMLKRQLTAKISNSTIDQIYDLARKHGALGGKLCGAGGGGFVVFYVPPDRQPAVKDALKDLLLVPFRFESLGSHVVFYST